MWAWLLSLVPNRVLVWGAVAVGLVAAGAVYLWRRDVAVARETLERVTAATCERELADRRIVDEVEMDIAGLDSRERRERLRAWGRDPDRRL